MKTLKRVLSMAMALMLLVGGLVVLPQEAKAADYTAALSFCDSAWGNGMWATEESAKATITGDGSYSVAWNAPEGTSVADAGVFVIDMAGAQAAMDAEGKTFEVTALTVKVDGTEVPVDVSKLITGDLEKNGNYRIEIYNMVGAGTATNPPLDNTAVKFTKSLQVDFTIKTIDKPADGEVTPVVLDCNAALSFCDSAWGNGMWATEESAITKVTGDGSYSVIWNAPEGTSVADAGVFVIDMAGAQATMDAEGKTLAVTALTVKVDGTEVPVDVSKILSGDLEGNGNYRIEIYNMVGAGTATNPPLDNTAVKFTKSLQVDFTLKTIAKTTDGEDGGETGGDEKPALTFDPAGKYNAYLGVQTPNWTYRNEWNADGYVTDPSLWGDFIYGNETGEKYGKVTDAKVEGNGTYRVSVTDFGTIFEDDFTTANQDYFNLLFISTDIPLSDDIKVTDVKLIVDGKTCHTDAEGFLDPDATDYVKILIQNIWNDAKKEITYYPAPTKSLEMEFTISGFNYDKAGSEEPDTTPDTTTPDTQTSDDNKDGNDGNILPFVIAAVVIVVVVVVVVVVLKKKKAE